MTQTHTKLCQCPDCVSRRYERFVETLTAFEEKNGIKPTNADQTVCVKSFRVRSHFRRNPYHMNNDQALKDRVTAYFKEVTAPIRPKGLPAGEIPGVRSRTRRKQSLQ